VCVVHDDSIDTGFLVNMGTERDDCFPKSFQILSHQHY